ncbi:hypothetical protein ANO11243_007910 [Dothideomycetidae sp. 11243]|nr:hypothetical protein ANO11243_007910 [fungal sp. No.11243]
MVELRKRKTPPPAAFKPAKKANKAKASDKKAAPQEDKVPATAKPVDKKSADKKPDKTAPASSAAKSKSGPAKVGDVIELEGFGGEVETHDGDKTTLKALIDKSKAGVVLFTYPKASTPGCTTQVCLFRDSYAPLTATGLDIYGLSKDSPKANTTFKTKQNLPYPLLCDKAATLIAAIGLKEGDKTRRGVFVVTKECKVLAAEPGGPAATVDAVRGVVDKLGADRANDDDDVKA